MRKRDPEEDFLPHCIVCDGRHTKKQTCEEFLRELKERQEKRTKAA